MKAFGGNSLDVAMALNRARETNMVILRNRKYRPRRTVEAAHGKLFGGSSRNIYAPNGAKECEKRRRQIARGSLRSENGLDSASSAPPREKSSETPS